MSGAPEPGAGLRQVDFAPPLERIRKLTTADPPSRVRLVLRFAQPEGRRDRRGPMRYRVLCGAELPRRLDDMASPPQSVYLWGELPAQPYVAIVGSRRVSEQGRAFVRKLAAELSGAGVTVISGGAKGIDAAAHEGALDAEAATLVVAPCGLDKPYPAGHRDLFRRIVRQGGGYLSLSADEQGARREHFHRRNAMLAALCDVLVLGEANFGSGGRNAAKHARQTGRAVFAVPSAAGNALGRGSNLELRAGARWLEDARDVLRYLAETGQLVRATPLAPAAGPRQLVLAGMFGGAPPSEVDAVSRALQAGKGHVDAICEHTQLSAARVHVALLELTLCGAARIDARGLLQWVDASRG